MRWLTLLLLCSSLSAAVRPGVEEFFGKGGARWLGEKRVGLITNQTGVDRSLRSTIDRCAEELNLVALFAPEHGLTGDAHAEKRIKNGRYGEIPVWSLHGETRRPTDEMLEGIDVLLFDIQDVGSRCYTYACTLFYAMEEAAKRGIQVIVLDRPNPINGVMVDGPMVRDEWRSFVGYINVPLCHGMTIGEMARFFNSEYGVGCDLQVVRMRGWRRSMSFAQTGLPWIPTSPQIPDAESPLYFPMTGLLGDLFDRVNIGVGYTLPFKVVGAPWMDGRLCEALNAQKMPGVQFHSCTFTPFYGRFKGEVCQGVRIMVSDPRKYRPVSTQFMILGLLKSLYPEEFEKRTRKSGWRHEILHKLAGSEEVMQIIESERYIAWPLIELDAEERKTFLQKRKKYLLY